jgi:hypothetical protein
MSCLFEDLSTYHQIYMCLCLVKETNENSSRNARPAPFSAALIHQLEQGLQNPNPLSSVPLAKELAQCLARQNLDKPQETGSDE